MSWLCVTFSASRADGLHARCRELITRRLAHALHEIGRRQCAHLPRAAVEHDVDAETRLRHRTDQSAPLELLGPLDEVPGEVAHLPSLAQGLGVPLLLTERLEQIGEIVALRGNQVPRLHVAPFGFVPDGR